MYLVLYAAIKIIRIMINMQNKFLLFTILLSLVLLAQACLGPFQIQGKCSACGGATQTLVKGYCYEKITGCLNYDVGPICTKCQNGYILSEKTCIRQAVYFNRTDLTPAPLVPDNASQLTQDQIQNALVSKYGPEFLIADSYFRKLNSGLKNIEKVETLKGKLGKYITIRYSAENSQFIAWAFVNYKNQVVNPQISSYLGIPNDPITSYNLVQNLVELQGYSLYQITGEYTIDSIDDPNNKKIVRVNLKKSDFPTFTKDNLRQKINITMLTVADLALQKIAEKYPYLNTSIAIDSDKGNGFYTFLFGATDSISVQFKNYDFIINKPLYIPPKSSQSSNSSLIVVGGWAKFINFQSPSYLAVLSFIRKQIPELAQAKVGEVQTQVVAGTNYQINFVNVNGYNYKVIVYRSFNTSMEITSAERTSLTSPASTQTLFSKDYIYNLDNIFFNAYAAASQRSQIANIPPIQSVQKKKTQDQTYFKVVYSPKQYMEFIIKGSEVHLLTYTIDGQNALSTIKDYIIPIKVPAGQSTQTSPSSCSNEDQYSILASLSSNIIDSLLYKQITNTIAAQRKEWSTLKPILVLTNKNSIKSFMDDGESLYQIILQPGTLVKILSIKVLEKSIGNSVFKGQRYPYSSLIIPKGVRSTSSLVNLVNQIVAASEKSLPNEISNPKIVIASIIETNSYRLVITTDKSPKDLQNQYYIEYDTKVSIGGIVQFFNAKKVFAKNFNIPNCGSYSMDGQCLDCSSNQISYEGQCFAKISNCQNQALNHCLRCNDNFGLANNKCIPSCG